MGDKSRGLFGKYYVDRVDGKPLKDDGCIVLEFKDSNARVGIYAFSRKVRSEGYFLLADDIDKKLSRYSDYKGE